MAALYLTKQNKDYSEINIYVRILKLACALVLVAVISYTVRTWCSVGGQQVVNASSSKEKYESTSLDAEINILIKRVNSDIFSIQKDF